ncbi:MAG: CinA family protein [Clostridia bacterium]|nr:CinA family protein [Clostridia bacterium]
MKGNLILYTQQDEQSYYFKHSDVLLQQFLCRSGIEINKTSIFKDFKVFSKNLINELEYCTIILMEMSTNNLDGLFSQLSSYYQEKPIKASFGFIWNGVKKCVLIDINSLNESLLQNNSLRRVLYVDSALTTIKLYGLDAFYVKDVLKSLSIPNNVSITTFSAFMDCEINLIAPISLLKTIEYKNFLRLVYETFNDYIYTDTEDTLMDRLIELLEIRKVKISICDNLTSGKLVEQMLNNKHNYKDFLVNSYNIIEDNDYIEKLGIDASIIEKHNANSIEFAYETCAFMLENEDSDVAISITGTCNKPFIAVGDQTAIHVYKFSFNHNKEIIEKIMINSAFFKLLKKINQNDLYFFKNSV